MNPFAPNPMSGDIPTGHRAASIGRELTDWQRETLIAAEEEDGLFIGDSGADRETLDYLVERDLLVRGNESRPPPTRLYRLTALGSAVVGYFTRRRGRA